MKLKKQIKHLIYTLGVLSLLSCQEQEVCNAEAVPASVYLQFEDELNTNLITAGRYFADSINVINAEFDLTTVTWGGTTIILNYEFFSSNTEIFLQLNNTDIDTIRVRYLDETRELECGESSIIFDQLTYNGNRIEEKDFVFTILK